MKVVVIGGIGLIGAKTVAILRRGGHEVLAAAPQSGCNIITGEGLKHGLAGAQVVIDLANSPSFEDKVVLEFFQTAGRYLFRAEAMAGVRHHVALSIVAIDRTDNGGKHSRASARPVSAHRGGRRCCCCCRCRGGAESSVQRHRRDRRPGTRAVQRNCRPLSAGGRQSARGGT